MFLTLSILCAALLAVVYGQGAPSILLPDPDSGTHGFKVTVSTFPLTDSARKDPYALEQDRSLMASVFMPVARDTCMNDCKNSYMPTQTSRIADQQFLLSVSSSVFERMGYTVCCGSAISIDASKLPVVLLEPHTDTSRLMYNNLARFIAANGIAVISLDHPGETSIVEFLSNSSNTAYLPTRYNSGSVQLSNYSPLTSWNATVQKALDTRAADIDFALSRLSSLDFLRSSFPSLRFSSALNTTTYGIVGHGLGGSIATSSSLLSKGNISFSINLSGTPPLPPSQPPSTSPIYFLGRANFQRQIDIHWPLVWPLLIGPATELDISNSEIMDFTDLPVILELARNEGGMRDVDARGLGGSGAWANHGVLCVVEGIVIKEVFGDGHALAGCVREERMGVVPYLGGVV